jgi:hypothetical protein
MNQRKCISLPVSMCAAALLILSASVFAEDDCGNAVDAADSMNVNQQECDYRDKGLNGFLQKAFKKGDEGAVLKTSHAESAGEGRGKVATDTSAGIVAIKEELEGFKNTAVLSVNVDQWANVPLAKNQLLPKLMERCNKGFHISGEGYRPLAMGRIELRVTYFCL